MTVSNKLATSSELSLSKKDRKKKGGESSSSTVRPLSNQEKEVTKLRELHYMLSQVNFLKTATCPPPPYPSKNGKKKMMISSSASTSPASTTSESKQQEGISEVTDDEEDDDYVKDFTGVLENVENGFYYL
jgi:hypothetical protein